MMKRLAVFLSVVLVGIGVGAGSTASANPSFPLSIYPVPVEGARHGYLAQCPNPKGIVPFTATAVKIAIRETDHFPKVSADVEKLASDRSFWTKIHGSKPGFGLITVGSSFSAKPESGVGGPAGDLINRSCGPRLLKRTQTVALIPLQPNGEQQNCDDCVVRFFYIDRQGHALLYFVF